MTEVQYLTLDSIQEGVGSSQVHSYIQKLAATWKLELVSFEKNLPSPGDKSFITKGHYEWRPLAFGKYGPLAGINRIWRLRSIVNQKTVVHARSDFAAFAAIISGSKKVIWDCRALTPDQRIAAKGKSRISLEYILLRFIEAVCAMKSKKIIVITHKARTFLQERYGIPESKFLHVSTCVDLKKFRNDRRLRLGNTEELRVALVGTIGPQYDIDLMSKILEELRSRRQIFFTISLSKGSTNLYTRFKCDSVLRLSHDEMPRFIASQDIGLSIWREDMGVSLLSVAATKNAEFLACGKPIIVNESQGDIGGWIRDTRTGVSTKNQDSYSVISYVDDILMLIDEGEGLSNRCRNLAEKFYSLENAVQQISDTYLDLKSDE